MSRFGYRGSRFNPDEARRSEARQGETRRGLEYETLDGPPMALRRVPLSRHDDRGASSTTKREEGGREREREAKRSFVVKKFNIYFCLRCMHGEMK